MTSYQIQNKVPTPHAGPQNPPDLAPSYIFNPFSLYSIRYRHNDPRCQFAKMYRSTLLKLHSVGDVQERRKASNGEK